MKPNERLAVHTETVPVSPAEASIPASQQSLAKIIRQGLSLFSVVYLGEQALQSRAFLTPVQRSSSGHC